MPKTIGVDFDGVIHTYEHGYHDGTIYGELIDGAARSIKALQQKYAVFVFTSRDILEVAEWLNQKGIAAIPDIAGNNDRWHDQETILVTNRKLIASVYIDDRAIHFTDWKDVLFVITRMELNQEL